MFNIGDIIVSSFIYQARMNYFWKVIRTTPKTVTVVQIGNTIVGNEGFGQNGTEIANPDVVYDDVVKVGRINKYGRLKINGDNAELWNGKPVCFYTD